jgi:hypothetical protein
VGLEKYQVFEGGGKMLSNGVKRGFPPERLGKNIEPKVKKDDGGYYVFTLNENIKVYFEDFYKFLERVEKRSAQELKDLEEKIKNTHPSRIESLSYYRARKIIVEHLLKQVYQSYSDGESLGVVMSPWCFGTVVLEKIELYRDRIGKGEAQDSNIPDYPYFVLKYIDEIYKKTLLEIFEFPEKAFSVRWQYTELLKRYSKVLSNINTALQNILAMVKSYNSSDK